MNKDEALKLLLDYLSPIQNDFVIHQCFLKDMMGLLKKELKESETKFFQQMVTQLDNIKHSGKDIHNIDGNEILRGVGNDSQGAPWDLYSIHLCSDKYNVRFIVKFDELSTPYLLYAFYERSGKRKTDYTIPIKISKERFLDLNRDKEDIL